MKHEQSAPAGYRPRFDGTTKLYLVRHKEYGELTVNGVNKYEAVHAAARAWGVRWTAIARECEYIVLAEDTPEAGIWAWTLRPCSWQSMSTTRDANTATEGNAPKPR